MKFFKRKPGGGPGRESNRGRSAGWSTATTGTGPVGFGYKSAWLAIRTQETEAVAEALRMTEAHAASWAGGIEAAYTAEPRPLAFLTPVADGWTLGVLGGSKLFEDDGLGSGVLDLASLSRRFGEVRKFATHRVVEYQEWQRWVGGSPIRRYCWVGESGTIRFDEGEPVRAEENLLRATDLEVLRSEMAAGARIVMGCRAAARPPLS